MQRDGQRLELIEGPSQAQFWSIGLGLLVLALVTRQLTQRPYGLLWVLLATTVMALLLNGSSLSVRRAVFDRARGELLLQSRLLLLRRTTTRVVPLVDLQGVTLQTADLPGGRQSHLLRLALPGGQTSSLGFKGRADRAQQALAARINAFLGAA